MSCWARMAMLSSGITVSSYPTIPGYRSSPACKLAMKLSWISCLTVFERQPLERSSASVVGLVEIDVNIATRHSSHKIGHTIVAVHDYSAPVAGGQGGG